MKQNDYFTLFLITAFLLFVLFFHWRGDMTLRFSTIVLINSLQGSLYMDKKIKRINQFISLVLVIVVFILGFCFDYFKY